MGHHELTDQQAHRDHAFASDPACTFQPDQRAGHAPDPAFESHRGAGASDDENSCVTDMF